MDKHCQCPCGHTQFSLVGQPILRIICHCEICQQFNQAPFSDVTVFTTKNVIITDSDTIDYQQYKPPPAVNRGKCKQCDKPAIEYMKMPLMPSMSIIPSANIPDCDNLIKPAIHIFYHRRVNDICDDLPKVEGFMRSQLAMTSKMLLSALGFK